MIQAEHLKRFWDWVDARQIDKHVVSAAVLWGTIRVTEWAMTYASASNGRPGLEVAAIIGAVTAPYMVLQGAAIKFYFGSREA